MKKRNLSFIFAIIFTFVLLTGCSNKSNSGEGAITTDNVTTQESSSAKETTDDKTKENTEDFIGEDRAIEIVLEKLPGALKEDIRIHMDMDDGMDMYEGSVVYEEIEYDFEIDALTGKILEWEAESIYD